MRLTLVNPTPSVVIVPPGARVATRTRVAVADGVGSSVAALPPTLSREEKLRKVLRELEVDSVQAEQGVKEAFIALLDKYLDAVASHDADLGRTDLVFHEIDTAQSPHTSAAKEATLRAASGRGRETAF